MVETINIFIPFDNPRFKPWAKKQIFYTTVSTVCANEIFLQIDVCVTQNKKCSLGFKEIFKLRHSVP
jgi:hypothetical protein